MYVRND